MQLLLLIQLFQLILYVILVKLAPLTHKIYLVANFIVWLVVLMSQPVLKLLILLLLLPLVIPELLLKEVTSKMLLTVTIVVLVVMSVLLPLLVLPV